MRYQFIEDHRKMYPVVRMCRIMEVSPSGFYAWRDRPISRREMANQELLEKIKEIYAENRQVYGSPRLYEALLALRWKCSKNRVARIMRKNGIRAKQTKRFKITTKANAAHPVAPNLLGGDFTADQPNQKWVTDITYISTLEGWLYLACVMDLFSRRIVGWAMSARMTSSLVMDALKMAVRQRQPAPGLLHHSDRGSQYTGHAYQKMLKGYQMQISMSGAGNCYDNAAMESFFGTLKKEQVNHCVYRTRDEARTDLFFYIESFYNRQRLHSTLGYLSPEAYERTYYQQCESALIWCPQN